MNAGRPLLLEGGLDWKTMSLSPKDMDFIEAKHVAAREIALAFGVPPMLLGIPGDNTYSNYPEANRTFWRPVLPLVNRVAWHSTLAGAGLRNPVPARARPRRDRGASADREPLGGCRRRISFPTTRSAGAGWGWRGKARGSGLRTSSHGSNFFQTTVPS